MTKEDIDKVVGVSNRYGIENVEYTLGRMALYQQGIPKTLDDIGVTADEFLAELQKTIDMKKECENCKKHQERYDELQRKYTILVEQFIDNIM